LPHRTIAAGRQTRNSRPGGIARAAVLAPKIFCSEQFSLAPANGRPGRGRIAPAPARGSGAAQPRVSARNTLLTIFQPASVRVSTR